MIARKLVLRDFLHPHQSPMQSAASYAQRVLHTQPLALWPLSEASGAAAICRPSATMNGEHAGVTLGQPGIGDGSTCPLYDGINDYTQIFSAALAVGVSGAAGSIMIWGKVADTAMWTDGNYYRLMHLKVDGSNEIQVNKTSADLAQVWYRAGGTLDVGDLGGQSTAGWFCMGGSWSQAAGQVIAYWNGAASAPAAGLGAWSGSITSARIGVHTSGWNYWPGYLAFGAVWDRVLAPAEFLALATV